jgi:hypothetical protein
MPCSDHAVLLKVTAQHGRRETACGITARFGSFRLPHRVPRRLLPEAYQSFSQRSIPTTVKSGSSVLKKRRSVKLLDKQFGYFRLPRGLSRRTQHCRSKAGARRVSLFPWRYNPLWMYFHSPVAGFSLLVFEVS